MPALSGRPTLKNLFKCASPPNSPMPFFLYAIFENHPLTQQVPFQQRALVPIYAATIPLPPFEQGEPSSIDHDIKANRASP